MCPSPIAHLLVLQPIAQLLVLYTYCSLSRSLILLLLFFQFDCSPGLQILLPVSGAPFLLLASIVHLALHSCRPSDAPFLSPIWRSIPVAHLYRPSGAPFPISSVLELHSYSPSGAPFLSPIWCSIPIAHLVLHSYRPSDAPFLSPIWCSIPIAHLVLHPYRPSGAPVPISNVLELHSYSPSGAPFLSPIWCSIPISHLMLHSYLPSGAPFLSPIWCSIPVAHLYRPSGAPFLLSIWCFIPISHLVLHSYRQSGAPFLLLTCSNPIALLVLRPILHLMSTSSVWVDFSPTLLNSCCSTPVLLFFCAVRLLVFQSYCFLTLLNSSYFSSAAQVMVTVGRVTVGEGRNYCSP